MTTMYATVRQVNSDSLLVYDHGTQQEVLVFTDNACCFRPCDRVCICYNGIMTRSIPPQITADRITKQNNSCC